MKKNACVIVDNIRSAYNVGSIFRTADGLGFSKVFLCGTTPCPKDRFGRKRKDIAKVALGAEETMPHEYFKSTLSLIKKLKKDGFSIIALEQAENSIDVLKVKAENKFALVLGNEVSGIEKKILNLCDIIAEIPMEGKKESLNVSVAFGLAGFLILNK
jgi:tRNA G18 (ribose-2'-O)-methylase SpoU